MRLSAAKAAEHIAPRYRILARYIIANICWFALLFTDQLSSNRVLAMDISGLCRVRSPMSPIVDLSGASVRHHPTAQHRIQLVRRAMVIVADKAAGRVADRSCGRWARWAISSR